MKNKSFIIGLFVMTAAVVCTNAYAAESCALSSFFGGVGGVLYNALPWNWGSWMGK